MVDKSQVRPMSVTNEKLFVAAILVAPIETAALCSATKAIKRLANDELNWKKVT